MKISSFGQASEVRVRHLEQKYDVLLPAPYRRFLLECNGGLVDPTDGLAIPLPALNETIQMETFFGLDQKERCFDMDSWMEQFGDELPAHSLLIGDDELKGFLLIICDGAEKGLYYWDDAHCFPQSDEGGNAYLIATDFGLLERLIPEKGGTEMNEKSILPLGSVVLLEGATRKLMVIARAIRVRNGNKTFFFDYGGVPYPEGLTGDQMAYFNADQISRVVFEGYRDVDDENLTDSIRVFERSNPGIERGNAATWDPNAK